MLTDIETLVLDVLKTGSSLVLAWLADVVFPTSGLDWDWLSGLGLSGSFFVDDGVLIFKAYVRHLGQIYN